MHEKARASRAWKQTQQQCNTPMQHTKQNYNHVYSKQKQNQSKGTSYDIIAHNTVVLVLVVVVVLIIRYDVAFSNTSIFS